MRFEVAVGYIEIVPLTPRLREPARAALRGECGDWPDELTADEIRSLVQHGVAPMVYAAARLPQLREEAIRAAAVEPFRAEDAREVLGALAAEGVEALLLKGTALAYELYDEPELRPRGDTDLLIARDAIERTRQALLARGFTELLTSGDEYGVRQSTFTRVGPLRLEHAYDVHWAVANTPVFAAALTFDDLRARAIPLPRLSPEARGLADVDALLLACIHRIAHHHDSDRLIWLADIALLRDRMTAGEHRRFWRLAADARVVAVCSRSIELAGEWMSRAPPDLAADHLPAEERERAEPSRVFLDRDITHGTMMLANLAALPWPARFRRLWQLAFPPVPFMRQSFGPRSRFALPWLYVYRGLRGVRRLFRRAA